MIRAEFAVMCDGELHGTRCEMMIESDARSRKEAWGIAASAGWAKRRSGRVHLCPGCTADLDGVVTQPPESPAPEREGRQVDIGIGDALFFLVLFLLIVMFEGDLDLHDALVAALMECPNTTQEGE